MGAPCQSSDDDDDVVVGASCGLATVDGGGACLVEEVSTVVVVVAALSGASQGPHMSSTLLFFWMLVSFLDPSELPLSAATAAVSRGRILRPGRAACNSCSSLSVKVLAGLPSCGCEAGKAARSIS